MPGADIWQAEGLITLPVALALRSRRGGRVVYDARDLHVESSRFARLPGPWRRLLARRERAWARSADAVITANDPYAAVLLQTLGVRATVVHNGPFVAAPGGDAATVAAVPIRERLGLPASTRIVLYLGNVAPGRGVEQLCRAIADVPAAVLVVVGPGGSFRDRLIAEAADPPGRRPDPLPAGRRAGRDPGLDGRGRRRSDADPADDAQPPPDDADPPVRRPGGRRPGRRIRPAGDGRDRPRRPAAGVLCDPTDPGSIAAAIARSSTARPSDAARSGRPPLRRLAVHTPGNARSRGSSRCTRASPADGRPAGAERA